MADSDDGWFVVRHIEGSANHKPKGFNGSWLTYATEHIDRSFQGQGLPLLCPGNQKHGATEIALERHDAHSIKGPPREDKTGSTSGCHALIRNKQSGREKYAIIPACQSCNTTRDKRWPFNCVPLQWFCRAVTIIDTEASKSQFAGMITLPKSNNDWWKRITALKIDDGNGTDTVKCIIIEGYSNKDNKENKQTPCGSCVFINNVCTKKECMVRRAEYPNPEDYLATLALLWRKASEGRDMGKSGVFRKLEGEFRADVIRCNVGMYPGANGNEYKEAYGLCEEEHCHRDRGDDGNFCGGGSCKKCEQHGCNRDRGDGAGFCGGRNCKKCKQHGCKQDRVDRSEYCEMHDKELLADKLARMALRRRVDPHGKGATGKARLGGDRPPAELRDFGLISCKQNANLYRDFYIPRLRVQVYLRGSVESQDSRDRGELTEYH